MGIGTGQRSRYQKRIYYPKRVRVQVTEMGVSTHGATEGKAVSEDVWTAHRLSPYGTGITLEICLQESIRDGVLYGTVSLYSPQQQETILYVGSEDEAQVWLNGELIYQNLRLDVALMITPILSLPR